MTLNLVETVTKYLQKHPEQKFTAREIANWILEAYPNKCQQKKENSTVINSKAELLQQIVAEIGARKPLFLALEEKKGIKIKMTEGRPRKYYFTTKSDVEEVSAVEHLDSGISPLAFAKVSVTELDLYPKLFEYLFLEFGLCSKRIDEKRSSNTRGIGGNRWLYPDVVAMENLSNEWV